MSNKPFFMPYYPVSVAILAGGKSSRMGQDKATLMWNGRPFIEHILSVVDGLGDELLISTNHPEPFEQYGQRCVPDIHPDCGALSGLEACLHQATHEYLLVVACDMPFLQRPLLELLLRRRIAPTCVVPVWQDRQQPLHALYHRSALAVVQAQLALGRYSLERLLQQLPIDWVLDHEIADCDPLGRAFTNINTPEQLRQITKTG